MNIRKIGVVLLALLLSGMAMVPMVNAQEANIHPGVPDIVDNATLTANTPPAILEMKSKGATEMEIAQYFLNLPKPRQAGWTEADNEKALSYFKQFPEKTMQGISPMYQDVQRDGRMVIYEYNYNGINGYMKPGNLEVSSTGTQAHYFTSHLGNSGNWVEVGVARFSYNPSQYIVFTYDSGRPSGQQWKTWGTTNSNIDHNFKIYVFDAHDGSGYIYSIWWDGILIDSGHVLHYYNNPDEVHEFFAGSANSFQACSQGYFRDTYLYKKVGSSYNTYWWNANLPEHTDSYYLSPVSLIKSLPMGSNSYRVTTWI
jgi:hypothetical protein